MQAVIGIAIVIGGIGALWWARPRNGQPRFFVNTQLEVPVVLAILGVLTVGTVLFVSGIVPGKS